MIPEGLQYRSISDIMAMLKGLGINSIRLTYAIEMIDQIEDNAGQDVPIQAAFVDALGQGNGTAIFEKVLSLNPSFSNDTTRLEVSGSSNSHSGLPANSSRCLTQSRPRHSKTKYLFTSTTIFPRPAGVVPPLITMDVRNHDLLQF